MTYPVCKSDADCVKNVGFEKGCCFYFDPGTANTTSDFFKSTSLPTTKGLFCAPTILAPLLDYSSTKTI